MEFRTKVEIQSSPFKINYQSGCIFIGSCFADNIGSRLKTMKFPVVYNPFGVLYNPVSVKDNLLILIEKRVFSENDLHLYNENWISFSHYSAFSNSDKNLCLDKINNSILTASESLSSAKYLFITFGTAWIYEFLKTGKIVANCHKIPSVEFRRFMLNTEQVASEYQSFFKKLKSFNPGIKVIFTLSPIRHWKDGAVKNQLSKSTLLVAIHRLIEEFEFVSYFPAYEIFMDELRDYRYYAKDMVHPSEVAIDYIWSRFIATYMSDEALSIMKETEIIIQAKNHRPLNPHSLESEKFRKKMLNLIENKQLQYPFLDLSEERNFFSKG